jgi:hypothetical protein
LLSERLWYSKRRSAAKLPHSRVILLKGSRGLEIGRSCYFDRQTGDDRGMSEEIVKLHKRIDELEADLKTLIRHNNAAKHDIGYWAEGGNRYHDAAETEVCKALAVKYGIR